MLLRCHFVLLCRFCILFLTCHVRRHFVRRDQSKKQAFEYQVVINSSSDRQARFRTVSGTLRSKRVGNFFSHHPSKQLQLAATLGATFAENMELLKWISFGKGQLASSCWPLVLQNVFWELLQSHTTLLPLRKVASTKAHSKFWFQFLEAKEKTFNVPLAFWLLEIHQSASWEDLLWVPCAEKTLQQTNTDNDWILAVSADKAAELSLRWPGVEGFDLVLSPKGNFYTHGPGHLLGEHVQPVCCFQWHFQIFLV